MAKWVILSIGLVLILISVPDTTKVKKEQPKVKAVDLKEQLRKQKTLNMKLDTIIKKDTIK